MWWCLPLLVCSSVLAEDSLRPALHALRKRQRDLIYYPPNLYGDGQPEDIGYGYQKSVGAGVFEPMAIPYPELGRGYQEDKKSSVFRERTDDDLSRPSPFRERLAAQGGRSHLARTTGSDISEDEYINILNSIWEKYRGEADPEEVTQGDVEELLDYIAEKEEQKRQYGNFDTGYDFFNSPMSWSKRSLRAPAIHRKRYQETLFDERYPYRGEQKRYPIAKRSPSSQGMDSVGHNSKNSLSKETDPKVAAELSNIFAVGDKKNMEATATTTQGTVPNATQETGQKEQQIESNSLKPLEVKKKSIQWSDYFGIDRRKKSIPDKDWLLKKYLEAYTKKEDDVDRKMKAMEDLIVDEAIKYTGAHEGSTDSNEIEQVKDKVLAQLAAAYSLEKMRRALTEFKASLAAQKSLQADEFEYKAKGDKADGEEKQVANRNKEQAGAPYKNRNDKGDCRLLGETERSCREILKRQENLIPSCTLHALCRICGDWPRGGGGSPEDCDRSFLEEVEVECSGDRLCLNFAKQSLNFARGLERGPASACSCPRLFPSSR